MKKDNKKNDSLAVDSVSSGSVPDWKGKTCDECKYFTGEECGGYKYEGSERYDDSDACDEFKPKAQNK